jgi:hypothetical protein
MDPKQARKSRKASASEEISAVRSSTDFDAIVEGMLPGTIRVRAWHSKTHDDAPAGFVLLSNIIEGALRAAVEKWGVRGPCRVYRHWPCTYDSPHIVAWLELSEQAPGTFGPFTVTRAIPGLQAALASKAPNDAAAAIRAHVAPHDAKPAAP